MLQARAGRSESAIAVGPLRRDAASAGLAAVGRARGSPLAGRKSLDGRGAARLVATEMQDLISGHFW